MTLAQWAEPALLWDNRPIEQRQKPQLLQLKSDDFLPEFLAAMKAAPDKTTSSNPIAMDFLSAAKMNGNSTLKLYQPLHSRYYLVTASLVCQQVGMPDKDVNLKKGEKTYFVLRRTQGGVEQGWSDKRGWVNITGKDCPVAADEEQFPSHPVSVCTGKDSSVVPCERKIYYGYIATGNREKYLDKQVVSTPSGSGPEAKIKQFFEDANKNIPVANQIDYRFDVFDTKVIAAWDVLNRSEDATAVNQGSTTILLEFINFLQQTLPVFWAARGHINSNGLTANQKILFDFLAGNSISGKNALNQAITITLKNALQDSRLTLDILDREEVAPPTFGYDVKTIAAKPDRKAKLEVLKAAIKGALVDEPSTSAFSNPADAEERLALIENQVRPIPISGKDDSYFLRMIYDYDPECPPIVSDVSLPFTFARNLEPDAPARLIRIEMPSIKPRDLRKFRHGVGMQLTPELRKVMDGVHEGMLKGEGLNDSSSWELGMICTFSIQIITLIAFILMFIIAIMLNIVFWWMAFLKICLPIPKKA